MLNKHHRIETLHSDPPLHLLPKIFFFLLIVHQLTCTSMVSAVCLRVTPLSLSLLVAAIIPVWQSSLPAENLVLRLQPIVRMNNKKTSAPCCCLVSFILSQTLEFFLLDGIVLPVCWLEKCWRLHVFSEFQISFIHRNIYTCAAVRSL